MAVTPLRLVVLNLIVLALFYFIQVQLPLSWPSMETVEVPVSVAARGMPLRKARMIVRGVDLPKPPAPALEVAALVREVVDLEEGEIPEVAEEPVSEVVEEPEVVEESTSEAVEEEPEPAAVPLPLVEAEPVEATVPAEPKAPVEMAEGKEPEAPVPAPVPEAESPEEVVAPADEPEPGATTVELYARAVKAARAAYRKKDWAGSVKILDETLALEDLIGEQRAWLLYLKAKAERRRGHPWLASRLYGEAIDHDPPGAHYKNSLAWLLATVRSSKVRDVERAVALAEEAVEESKGRAQYLDTLARAYFEAGRLEDAVLTQRRAVSKAPGNESYENRLSWYREEATGT